MELRHSNFPSATIDSEEKPENVTFHKPPVKSYASRVFQVSTIGIVSSIFSTQSKCRRFFKVFISSLCVAGFMYHCTTFLNHVLGYPEVVDISLDSSETYNWPAYTYCNNNQIRRSVFCSLQPERCVQPSEEFCQKFSSYCGPNATLVPKSEYYNRFPYAFQSAWVLKFGGVPNVLNISDSEIKRRSKKEKVDEISGPYLRTPFYKACSKSCYTIHSVVESTEQPLQMRRWPDFYPSYKEWLRFYVNETEMMNPRSEPGIYFSVHSPFEAVNPLVDGIFLKSGRTYQLHVEMQEEHLLKAPFISNCLDYEELWEKNNRIGPRSKKMCQDICKFGSEFSYKLCAPLRTLYPHKERICDDDEGQRKE